MTEFITELQHVSSQGGFALWALLVLGILLYSTLTRVGIRLIELRDLRRGELPPELLQEIQVSQTRRELTHLFASFELDKLAFIQRRLPFALILTGVAPLAGLLGTVSGMLLTFSGLANSSAAKPLEKISAGVSEALITTQAGLVIAIPAAILTALLISQAKATESQVQRLLHHHIARLGQSTSTA